MKTKRINVSTFIFLFVLLSLFFSCNARLKTSSNIEKPNERFKYWLKDTLNSIKKNKQLVDYFIAPDSLSFTIKKVFKITHADKINNDSVVSVMLELLKEYDEIPNEDYNISFEYEEFYYPSEISKLKYEMIYEIKNFVVFENNCTHEYTYNRGSLIGKIKQCGKYSKERFEFRYTDDKLTKIKITP
jgi:hypothetical protein